MLIYVAGVGFSGSTLLSFLVNRHSQMACVGELTGPQPDADSQYSCSCGASLGRCEFWRSVVSEMGARGLPLNLVDWGTRFDLGATRIVRHLLVRSLGSSAIDRARDRVVASIPSYEARLLGLYARNRALVESVLSASGRSVLVDASKHPIRARFLRHAGFGVRLVHLVRDAPGFVASCRKNQGMPLRSAVRLWKRGNAQVERLRAEWMPSHFMRLRYEDLCEDPNGAVNAVARLASLADEHLEQTNGGGHVVGNSMRMGFGGAIVRDDRWRTLLAPDEIAFVLRSTERVRRRYGYPDAESSSR